MNMTNLRRSKCCSEFLEFPNCPDLDMHSIPAMSAKCEQVVSSHTLLITDQQARIRNDVMLASALKPRIMILDSVHIDRS